MDTLVKKIYHFLLFLLLLLDPSQKISSIKAGFLTFIKPTEIKDPLIIEAFSGLSSTKVAHIVIPKTEQEIQDLVKKHKGPISIAGGRYSMGGQIAHPGGLLIDMKNLDNILYIDKIEETVKVQTGITWRKLQTVLDSLDLSVKSMQSYSSFSIGGTIAVNAHGREINDDPIVHTVQSLGIILANGDKVEASRTENPDLFSAAIGGYGLVGIITEATLSLRKNVKIESSIKIHSPTEYLDYFRNVVQKSPITALHSAYLDPLYFEKILSVTWLITDKPLTIKDHLKKGLSLLDRISINLARFRHTKRLRTHLVNLTHGKLKNSPFVQAIGSSIPFINKRFSSSVTWLNYEMSDDVASLSPFLPTNRTSILQEYFIPVDNFIPFITLLKNIVLKNNINLLNIGIRYVRADGETILPYAPEDSFAFVLYIDVPRTGADVHNRQWTQQIVNAALSLKGRYYLPYHLYPTVNQFKKAYPEYKEFIRIKNQYDPHAIFKNNLYKNYLEET